MRVHGRARIDRNRPEALGVCDWCGFLYNHNRLSWAYDWRGPNLQNLGFLVCESCLDTPQQNGQRTIILPPDPVSIRNARPQNFLAADNPMSPIGLTLTSNALAGGFIGTMTGGGGVVSAFDGVINKPWNMCAYISVSNSSYGNYVGKNWAPYIGGITTPSSLSASVTTHSLSSFTAYAPNDRSFGTGPVDYLVQGSQNAVSWTTLSSGTTLGDAGEAISGEPTGTPYRFHRLAFQGDGATPIVVAQVQFSVAQIGSVT